MMSPLVSSLWITLIGMVLVFIAILILWGLMEALMRFTRQSRLLETRETPDEVIPETVAQSTDLTDTTLQKKRAAAAAVAVAMSIKKPAARPALNPQASSAWQAVTRASQLTRATQLTRKNRGNVR